MTTKMYTRLTMNVLRYGIQNFKMDIEKNATRSISDVYKKGRIDSVSHLVKTDFHKEEEAKNPFSFT